MAKKWSFMHDWLRCVKLAEKSVGHLKKGSNGKFTKTIFYVLNAPF